MSKHQEWKMIHLLYRVARRRPGGRGSVLTAQELIEAGVHCEPDTHDVLEDAGIVTRFGDEYELARPVREIVRRFTSPRGRTSTWTFEWTIPRSSSSCRSARSGRRGCTTTCSNPRSGPSGSRRRRGDSTIRVGELSTNVWRSITQAGLVVADVSVPTPNVYYEIGLDGHARQGCLPLQAARRSVAGGLRRCALLRVYERRGLPQGQAMCPPSEWAAQASRQPFGVKRLEDVRRRSPSCPVRNAPHQDFTYHALDDPASRTRIRFTPRTRSSSPSPHCRAHGATARSPWISSTSGVNRSAAVPRQL